MCVDLSLLYFIYFNKFHISVLIGSIITMESRKVILENQINFGLYFSTVELCFIFWHQKDSKWTMISNVSIIFLQWNFSYQIKTVFDTVMWMDDFESVIKSDLPSRLKWKKDAFYLRWYFLHILLSLALILLIVILLIASGRENINFVIVSNR